MNTATHFETPSTPDSPDAPHNLEAHDEEARLKAFGEALDAIKRRVEARMGDGAEDLEYIQRVDAFSRAMETVGRFLLHTGRGPVTFALGVGALWIHKQLQATEVGHTALHGAYDKIEGAERFHSKGFRWETPIDEASWRRAHNVRHHQYTNVVGRDPDVSFGPMRNAEHLPYDEKIHKNGVPGMLLVASHFALGIQAYYTGFADYYGLTGHDRYEFIEDKSLETRKRVWQAMLRKFVPYYGREVVLYPLLSGTNFFRVLAGNMLTELMRDLYSAATIFCGHINEEVEDYPVGTRAGSRARWYKMQVESTHNFEVPLPISQLCGALDRQIEHHLFPKLPPNRLREIAPAVKAACEAHGVKYNTSSWGKALLGVFRQIRKNSRPPAAA